jgi:hypothetical protein
MIPKLFFCIAIVLGISSVAGAQTTKPFTVTGKIEKAAPGSSVYLEANSQPTRRLDSAKVQAGNTFTLKSQVADGGEVLVLNVGGGQKLALLVEGGETLNVVADGYRMDPKTGQMGKATVTGSKNMEYYNKLNTLRTSMEARVATWNKQVAAATERKTISGLPRLSRNTQPPKRRLSITLRLCCPTWALRW